MQDIHMIGTSNDPLFGGGRDRRTNPPPHNLNSVKCPRCESVNTKFCYYNNYNLSQPRHFCKSCRRYWTKGGVLRNVPVGGGCRRSAKRSKAKPKPSSSSDLNGKSKSKSNSNSNSNSQSSSQTSGLTVTATAMATATATASTAAAVLESSPASPSTLISYENQRLHVSVSQPSFDPLPVDRGEIFPEIGSFTNLMTSSNDSSVLGFNFTEISPYKLSLENQNSNQQCDVMDPTVEIELSRWQNRTTEVGFPAVDWQPTDQDGVFDLTGNVDHSYWSQTQWSDHEVNDNPLNYLP